MKIHKKIFLILPICFLLFSCNSNPSHYQDQVDQGKETGELIINAINGYKAENEVYPDSLQDLIPDYFITIPSPPHGQYEYKLIGNSFDLTFVIFNHIQSKYSCASWEHTTLGRIWDCAINNKE